MNKPDLDLIIRGFLYRENWTPLSFRRTRVKNYTIDFLKCADTYKILIDRLQNKYNVNLYFTSYDTTPKDYLAKITELFNPRDIFISSEEKSSQFTTSCTALQNDKICKNNHLKILIRSDIILTNLFIETLYDFNFNQNVLYTLCKEKNIRNKVIDVIHIFPAVLVPKMLEYLSIPNLRDAHKIHKYIYTRVLKIEHNCTSTDGCKEFFSIYS